MSNSSLVAVTILSPNNSGARTKPIDIITPHCVVGQCTAEALGNLFAQKSRRASSNYGIDKDGRVGLYVEEKNRSWCTSSSANDNRAVTIECASDTVAPYAFRDACWQTLVKLCADICRRNGKKKLLWLKDKETTLAYKPAADEMLLTVHRWYANKSCPGDWCFARMGELAARVTAELGGATAPAEPANPVPELYRVRKTWSDFATQKGAYKVLASAKKFADANPGYLVFNASGLVVYTPARSMQPYKVNITIPDLNIRKGPGTTYAKTGLVTGKGVFTIIEEAQGPGSTKGWGKLKSGAGWIALDYATKL